MILMPLLLTVCQSSALRDRVFPQLPRITLQCSLVPSNVYDTTVRYCPRPSQVIWSTTVGSASYQDEIHIS